MRRGTTLLVTSAGGHLTQMQMLVERFSPEPWPATWVSYDCPHAETALETQHRVHGHGPSTRSLGKAARNWQVAARILAGGHIERVISTGAGIAVPFLLEASRRGIPAHYLESASRVTGPSMTGQLLHAFAPAVRLYTQHVGWADARWQYAGSVFDGFVPTTLPAVPRSTLRILVSLGTHEGFRFDRLIQSVGRSLRRGDEVVWQLGVTDPPQDLPGLIRTDIPSQEMEELIRCADVVVAHAGTGVITSCLQAGRHPVVVPRRSVHHEHVDDHQTVTATEVARLGLATSRDAGDLSRSDLLAAARQGCERSTVRRFELRDGVAPRRRPSRRQPAWPESEAAA